MIRATTTRNGVRTLIVGLTFHDLTLLQAAPGDDYITLKGADLDLSLDIIIFANTDDAALFKSVEVAIGPDTKLRLPSRVKN